MKITYEIGNSEYKTVECKGIDRTWDNTILIDDGTYNGIEISFSQLVCIKED